MALLMHRLVYTPEAIAPSLSFPPPPRGRIQEGVFAEFTPHPRPFDFAQGRLPPHGREGMRRQAGRGERCKALVLTGERHPMPPAGEDVTVQHANLLALPGSEWVTGCCSLYPGHTSAWLEACPVLSNRVQVITLLVGSGPVLSLSKPALS